MPSTAHHQSFEAMADTILYRWSAERDTWVSASEVEEARAYLARQGIATSALPDGRTQVDLRRLSDVEGSRHSTVDS